MAKLVHLRWFLALALATAFLLQVREQFSKFLDRSTTMAISTEEDPNMRLDSIN